METYLDELNDVQREAVVNTEGPMLVIAGAGSGKTRVLTYRIAHLLKEGRRPWNILSLTFTNKAAKEMKERIGQIVDPKVAASLWMGTFHSIFSRILRREADSIGYPQNFTIYDTADSRNLIKTIIKEFNLNTDYYKVNEVHSRISKMKNNFITAGAYPEQKAFVQEDVNGRKGEFARIYQTYAQRCFKSGAMDFDDLLLNVIVLFKKNPDTLAKYQQQFSTILIDEYQDTNLVQYIIIKKLAEGHNNICVVGDDSQSIYSFRGARIENILNYQRDYPNCRIIKLEQNYRSTQNIVNAGNSIIDKNRNKIPKEVFSENETGEKIKVVQAHGDIEEAYFVSHSITERHLRDHYNFKDFAILYRTNAQSRAMEEALRKRNIPYRIYSGISFYQRKEVKDVVAYCRVIINQQDDEAVKRIINYPKRGIGGTSVDRIEQFANENQKSMWEVICNLPRLGLNIPSRTQNAIMEFARLIHKYINDAMQIDAYEVVKNLVSETGIIKELYSDKTPEGVSRYENVSELLNGIKEFTDQKDIDKSELKLADYLQDVALLTNEDLDKDENADSVSLMTIHSAKGLEYENVYIVGVEEGLFPGMMSVSSSQEIEEERRLFYVAVTRAKKHLTISFALSRYKFGQLVQSSPSRFFKDIDPKLLEVGPGHSVSGDECVDPEFEEPVFQRKSGFKAPEKSKYNFSKKDSEPETNNPGLKVPSNFKPASKIHPSQKAGSIDGAPSSMIKEGVKVEHQRFGIGVVVKVEGTPPNSKATIAFENAGQKQLLLKFAKLSIIE